MHDPNLPESWLEKAESDFRVIRACLEAEAPPWDMVAFHSQQSAEKCLKACLVARGHGEPPRVHDLLSLLGHCCADHPSLNVLTADCVLLNQHAIAPRYPGMPEPTEADAQAAVAAAERVRAAIRQHIGM